MASNWFGNLQLAYKYIIVFLSLLVITILAGFIKVLYNRQKLKKAKQVELEAGPREDTVELNQREKDEGDLFGIRAIEAGFYAGVAQSRPTSRAGSVMGDNPAMSTSTLVGGSASSPLMKGQSNNASVLSLNLHATKEPSKLRPSDAELNGRHDMSLQTPSSPGHPRGLSSPTFGGSDNYSEGFASARSMSPADTYQHYAPVSNYTTDGSSHQSQSASYSNSLGQSATPPSPYSPPTARLPTIPGSALRKDTRSPSPEYDYPRVQVHEPNPEPAQSPSSAPKIHLQPRITSHHAQNGSDASSMYSNNNRLSAFRAYQAYQSDAQKQDAGDSVSDASTTRSGRTSLFASSDVEGDVNGQSHSLLPPGVGGQDARLSEFYDSYYRNSYYRNSHIGASGAAEPNKQVVDRQLAITEVDTPLASPMFPPTQHPGTAI
ncbi:integral membrane [Pyrenophora seminiperda CCB06]|uniref:Integral membrane n=1 Tax=Pyrenophora seminiperda CCB06 TaxID=1302712 RepID=A0A3M7M0T6_9PLEO|nr:integral membrane [Pyrenophora seminiperda CCB06]